MSVRPPVDEDATPSDAGPRPRPPRLAFGPFIADPETGRLTEGDRVIPLTPQPFETLYYLARRSGSVVSKAELIEQLWRDTSVTDGVLVQCVMDIRRALGETAKDSQYVQTLPRRGYRFVAPVRVVSDEETAPDAVAPPAPAHRRRVWLPLAAVL